MNTTESEPSLSGSVFTVDLENKKVLEGLKKYSSPNEQSFDVCVIKFHDSGRYVDLTQLSEATNCIRQARQANRNGAVVVVFIHGWHHNAEWNRTKDDGDSHFTAFRKVLAGLTLREAERYPYGAPGGRRVIGIYFGWNGDPAKSWLRDTRWLTHLSFKNRYSIAKKIGESADMRKALKQIFDVTKERFEEIPESPLILIGHSMGALMLESAFLSLLTDRDKVLVHRGTNHGNCVEIRQDGHPISFADVLIAINSAADSRIANEITATLKNQKITKTLRTPNVSYSPPLFISLTSPADWDTKITWRLAQFPQLWRKTDGHDRALFTHTFGVTQKKVSCNPKGHPDFGQNWHCLHAPTPAHKPTPTIPIDLPTRERQGVSDKPDHDRYQLRQLVDQEDSYPTWIFQVPPDIISNHNDIFNSRSGTLIMALIQISGAIMSLAQDFESTFEK